MRAMTGPREPTPAVRAAWHRIRRAAGNVPVGALADEIGCSRHYLWRSFREEIGLSPKTMARILRFRRALRILEGSPSRALAVVAHRCGYYDQSHMIRDFRAFAGASPTEWQRLRLPEGGGVRDA